MLALERYPVPAIASDPDVATFAAIWLRRRAPTVRPLTIVAYTKSIRTVIGPVLGAVLLTQISRAHVLTWLGTLAVRGLRPATIHLALAIIGMLCREAIEMELRSTDPTRGLLRRYNPRPRLRTVYTAAEMAEFLAVAGRMLGPIYAGIYALCGLAGLRIGEARGVQVGDIEIKTRRLHVVRQLDPHNVPSITKGGDERTVECCASLMPHLAALVQGDRSSHAWLCAEGDAYPPPYHRLWRTARRVAARAHLPVLSLHALRHGYGSRLAAAGVSVQFVSRALGHADVAFTQRVYCSHLPLARPAILDTL